MLRAMRAHQTKGKAPRPLRVVLTTHAAQLVSLDGVTVAQRAAREVRVEGTRVALQALKQRLETGDTTWDSQAWRRARAAARELARVLDAQDGS